MKLHVHAKSEKRSLLTEKLRSLSNNNEEEREDHDLNGIEIDGKPSPKNIVLGDFKTTSKITEPINLFDLSKTNSSVYQTSLELLESPPKLLKKQKSSRRKILKEIPSTQEVPNVEKKVKKEKTSCPVCQIY